MYGERSVLAYQIENQKYGSFILLQFEGGEQDQMNEFNTWMKLNNSVLRHMTVALDEQARSLCRIR